MAAKLAIPERKTIKKPLLRAKRSLRSKIALSFLTLVALGSAFILALPYLPQLGFFLRRPKIDSTSYQQAVQQTKEGKPAPTDEKKQGNRLVLPDIGVDAQIIEGKSVNVIGKNQGVWRETATIDPSTPGNIVIAGHRFLYTARNGGWFYSLPELKNGNRIFIRWQDKMYEYEVYSSKTVLPTQVDIRNNDPNVPKKLTMYTCYPLGSTAKRFVIEARQL